MVLKGLVWLLVHVQGETEVKDVNENQVTIVESPQNGTYSGTNLPVTQADFDTLREQRRMLMEFVSGELRKNSDYGVIPGTPKSSLYKPGAEKLKMLFGLGARFDLLHKEFDRHDNFAMFTYRAEIYHLKTGQVIAQCEGSCNSQEKKYKERAVYEKNRRTNKREFVRMEQTPVCDIVNTLMKMAQKRAFVGGVILAVGASDFFNQDIDEPSDVETLNVKDTQEKAPSSVPGVKSATSTDDTKKNPAGAGKPRCCANPRVMVSKRDEDTWYCLNCKTTTPMGRKETA